MFGMFVYIRQKMTSVPDKDGVPAALYVCSKSGWTVGELFIEWPQNVVKVVNS